jgi:type I restriction-modification system DNA methylase subunit
MFAKQLNYGKRYQALKKETGEEKMSEKINEILYKALFKEKKSLFGTMEKTDISDLRDQG